MTQYREKTQRNILRTSSLLSIDVYSAGLFGCKIRASDPKGSQTNECALWLCQTKGILFLCFRCSSPLKSCYKKKTFARIEPFFLWQTPDLLCSWWFRHVKLQPWQNVTEMLPGYRKFTHWKLQSFSCFLLYLCHSSKLAPSECYSVKAFVVVMPNLACCLA